MSQTRLNNTSLWCTTYQIRELNKRVYDSYCMNLRLYFPYYLKCGLIKHVYNITYAYYEYASVISAASQTCFDANISSSTPQTRFAVGLWCGSSFCSSVVVCQPAGSPWECCSQCLQDERAEPNDVCGRKRASASLLLASTWRTSSQGCTETALRLSYIQFFE